MYPLGERVVGYKSKTWDFVPLRVVCENCGYEFVYKAERQAIASAKTRALAEELARRKLASTPVPVELVPCPQCGFYQEDMVAYIRTQRFKECLVGAVGVGLALICIWVLCDGQESSWFWHRCQIFVGVGTILAAVYHVARSPNAFLTEEDRKARAAESSGVSPAEYLRLLAEKQAEREATFAHGHEAARDFIEELGSSPDWRADFRKSQAKIGEKQERQRPRVPIPSILALALGGFLGAVLDAAFFHGTWQQVANSVLTGVLGGGFGSAIGSWLSWTYDFDLRNKRLWGDSNTRKQIAKASSPRTMGGVCSLIFTEFFIMAFAVGDNRTMAGIGLILLCQAALIGVVWWRRWQIL